MSQGSALLSPSLGWIFLALFSLSWILLGMYWGRKNKSFDDHALAGRNVGFALGTATAVATWITSNTTMLAPQFALQLGVWGMLAYSTASFGLFLFALLAERIRILMPHGYTSGDFMRLRYGSATWGVFMALTLVYSLTWLITMAMAGGIVLNSLSGIPYEYGMTAILVVCVLYTMRGGLHAVIGTDFIQSLIILIGIVIVGGAVLTRVDMNAIYANLVNDAPALLDVMFPAAIMAVFNSVMFGLGEIFHNNVWWSRAFAFRDGIGKRAYLAAGLIWFPVPIVAGFLALPSGALGITMPSPDMAGPLVAAHVLGRAGAIAIFIIVFCSLASSIDSLLAATSDLITKDLYRHFMRPQASSAHLKQAAQVIIGLLGLATWLVCLLRPGTLATVLFFAGPLVGSMIWPIVTGLYWERANSKGALSGMIAGSVVGLIAYTEIGWYVGALTSAAVSMACVLYWTYRQPHPYAWSLLKERPL